MADMSTTKKQEQPDQAAQATKSDALSLKDRAGAHIKAAKGTMKGLSSNRVADIVELYRPALMRALPKHITPDRMIQMSTTLITRNPKIAECTAESIVGAILQSSLLGFQPIAELGQCYFVPYAGQVQLQIGYRGWVTLGYRSDRVSLIDAHAVFKADEFEYEYGAEPKLRHVPRNESKEVVFAYAKVQLKGGAVLFRVLNRSEIEDLRRRNAMQKGEPTGAWKTDYPDMACAKVVKKLARYIPGESLQRAELIDESVTEFDESFDPDAVPHREFNDEPGEGHE